MRAIAGLLASFATKKLDVLRKQMRIQSFSEASPGNTTGLASNRLNQKQNKRFHNNKRLQGICLCNSSNS